jgi:hypothetical protein
VIEDLITLACLKDNVWYRVKNLINREVTYSMTISQAINRVINDGKGGLIDDLFELFSKKSKA